MYNLPGEPAAIGDDPQSFRNNTMEVTLTTFINPLPHITTPTSAITFTLARTDANGAKTWTSPGPNGDLLGRYVLKRAAQKTKAGIVGRTIHLTIPRFNAVTGKYDSSIQVRTTVNAPAAVPYDEIDKAVMYHTNLLSEGTLAGSDTFYSNYVKGNDLPI